MVGLGATDGDLSTLVGWGELTADEMIGGYTVFVNSLPTPLVLWDLTSASLTRLRTEDLSALARSLAQLAMDRRPPGKTALVVGPQDVEYATARMLSGFLWIQKYPVTVDVFRDATTARAWLLETQGLARSLPSH
jgi:hypothetical protein